FGEGVPGEEQALAWKAQAAENLAALHAQGIVNCNIELANLVVQPGDRLGLIDLTGCESIHEVGVGGSPLLFNPLLPIPIEAKSSDLRNLAGELEHWYLAVRQEASPLGAG